jgi:glutamyl-Q tRNA(Asp) synthetase
MTSATRIPTITGSTRYRGRFAPSPTGPLHFGSLVAALGSWLIARQRGGDWLVRIEDIDPPREVPGTAHQQIETLKAFGLRSDEPILRQSTRGDAYAQALDTLLGSDKAFVCRCSRSDLAADSGIHRSCVNTIHHGCDPARPPAIRLHVGDERVGFEDAIQGHFEQSARDAIGDFVLRRADGLWAYQLAVVVDDAAQGISEVVRGADLLDSTPRQILLQRALGLPTPAYAHLPLAVDEERRKLAKSNAALPVDAADPMPALRAAFAFLGQDVDAIAGARTPDALLRLAVDIFNPARIPRVLQCVADPSLSQRRIDYTSSSGGTT